MAMYEKFEAMAQGKQDYSVPAFPVKTETYGTLLALGTPDAVLYITKEQAMNFFDLVEKPKGVS